MIQVNKTTIPSLNSDSGYFVNSFNEMIIESGEKVPFENKRIADEIIDNGLIAYQKIITKQRADVSKSLINFFTRKIMHEGVMPIPPVKDLALFASTEDFHEARKHLLSLKISRIF